VSGQLGITCPARSSRRRRRPRRCRPCRSGRLTPTASWSARDSAWSTASRPSPWYSTLMPCPRRAPVVHRVTVPRW